MTVVRDSELLKISLSIAILNSLNDISSKTISQIEPKLYGRHRSDIVIQNCYDCSVPISKMAVILKFFKRHYSPPKPKVGLSQNLMGSITVTQRFRIAKIVRISHGCHL